VTAPALELGVDHASTYSYVAAERIEPLAAAAGVAVRWRPFLLGPIFTEQLGIQDSPFFFGQDRLEDALAWARARPG
jgi:2-hydroxychromene-2-carboxylate isomerase